MMTTARHSDDSDNFDDLMTDNISTVLKSAIIVIKLTSPHGWFTYIVPVLTMAVLDVDVTPTLTRTITA